MIRRGLRNAVRRMRGALHAHHVGLQRIVLVLLATGVLVQAGALWACVLTRDSIPWDSLRTRLSTSAHSGRDTDNSACALPVRFAARGTDGLYGIQYNTEGLKTAYEQTADVWAQAYEHAGEPVIAASAQYRAALHGQLLMMEYNGSIPLHIAAGWLGSEVNGALADSTLGTAALCLGEDGYTLWLRDSESGTLLCAQTTVDDSLFAAALGRFESNDCALAADQEDSVVSPDLLYFPGGETFDVMSFQPYSGGDGMEELLTAFGLDAQVALEHAYGTDGVMVYVSGGSTVRMAEDGSMRYDGTGVRLPVTRGHDRLMQCIQTGYELTGAALEAIDCGASPALIKAYTDPDSGRYIVVYGMQIGGVPVDNAITGYFARYEFEGDAMVHANLALRTCQSTGETVAVMPERQAAASLSSAQDAVLSLRYIDQAVGTNSSWEQLYDDATDDLWNAEDEQTDGWQDTPAGEDGWNDVPAGDQTGDGLGTAWYDTTGTPVSLQWYVLRYGDADDLPDFGPTLSPEEIVVVQADFDRMIQGGGAA